MKAVFGWIPVWLRPQIATIRWRIIAEVLLLLVLSCVPVGSAELSRYAIDRVIGEQSMENLCRLLKYAVVFLTVVVILKYSLSWLSALTRQRLALDIRKELWRRWVDCVEAFSVQEGEVANRLLNDVFVVGDVIISCISTTVVNICYMLVLITALFRGNQTLAWIAMSFVPGYLIMYCFVAKKIRVLSGEMRASSDKMLDFLSFRWRNLDGIRSFNGTKEEVNRFCSLAMKQYRIGVSAMFVRNLAGGIGDVLMIAWSLGLFAVGAFFVLTERITLGELMATQLIAAQVVSPIRQLLTMNLSWQQAVVSIARIMEIEKRCVRKSSFEGYVDEGNIFRNGLNEFSLQNIVCHNGQSNESKQINLKFGMDHLAYLLGCNGSGKSSVSRIIAGLRLPFSGDFRINGMLLDSKCVSGLCRRVLLLNDTQYFFEGTIRENLLYGNVSGISDKMLLESIADVGLDNWVAALPRGLGYHLTDGALNLSNGQRQRLASARALLREWDLLIVDEALTGLALPAQEMVLAKLESHGRVLVTKVNSLHSLSVEVQ